MRIFSFFLLQSVWAENRVQRKHRLDVAHKFSTEPILDRLVDMRKGTGVLDNFNNFLPVAFLPSSRFFQVDM